MNCQINELMVLLKNLNNLVQENSTGKIVNTNFLYDENYLCTASICKFLFDLPIQIWNSLHQENFVQATYLNFYAEHILKICMPNQHFVITNNISAIKFKSIENLSFYIIENCWNKINKQITSSSIDYRKIAEIFSCLILLKNFTLSDLIAEFFYKNANAILSTFNENNSISFLIQTVINIIFNTIRCSKIFQKSSSGSLFTNQFKLVIDFNLSNEIFNYFNNLITLPINVTQFKIRNCFENNDFNQIEIENILDRSSILAWIDSTHEKFYKLIEDKFKYETSIKNLYLEINDVEKRQQDFFKDWNEFNSIINVNEVIWKKLFINAFEKRVYEITNENLESIKKTFILSLPSYEKILLNCDLNIVESIWIDQEIKNNDFMMLIKKSFEMINNQLDSFFKDITIFKDNYQQFLDKIYLNINQFLLLLKEQIDLFKHIKQFLLFGAVFFQKMPELCPSLSSILSIKNETTDHQQSDWDKIQNEIASISESYLLEWLVIIITEHFTKIDPNILSDLTEFLKNFSIWEKVTLTNENEENNSSIEVPIQLSLCTFEILQNICNDINRYCAHLVPKKVLNDILILVGEQLLLLYENSIKNFTTNESLPKSTKQILSIQLYFDLVFIKKIFIATKDEKIRIDYLSKINKQLTLLEANVDPFDMHIIHPLIDSNTEKLHRSYQITFGFLFSDRYPVTSANSFVSSSDVDTEIVHNLMLVHSYPIEFKMIKPIIE